MYSVYLSKNNSKCEKQVTLSMIPKRKIWNYIAVRRLLTLRGITPIHEGDFYYLNCLHSFWTKNKLKSHGRVCKHKKIFLVL